MNPPQDRPSSMADVLADLVTQLRRIADHTSRSCFTLAPPPAADAPPTPATECIAYQRVAFEADPRQCIRPAHHHGDHVDEQGYHWSETVATYPVDDDQPATCRRMETRTCPPAYNGPCGDRRPCARFESDDPAPWLLTGIRDLTIPEQRAGHCEHDGPHAGFTRVTALYERWVKAGPPPLGASMARWWDQRLAELREALTGGQRNTPPPRA
ncbi:hypothetical protein ABTX35_33080 [Streptomyces sp. NPDC096080]|uniref:hypothetical protein n=1 Tax=Streptomyces sp. NPDC096080 TaxID=3156693 RepID=UPI00332EDFEA